MEQWEREKERETVDKVEDEERERRGGAKVDKEQR